MAFAKSKRATGLGEGRTRIVWTLSDANVGGAGDAEDLGQYERVTFQVAGSGTTASSVNLDVSNDGGTTWTTHVGAITAGAAGAINDLGSLTVGNGFIGFEKYRFSLNTGGSANYTYTITCIATRRGF